MCVGMRICLLVRVSALIANVHDEHTFVSCAVCEFFELERKLSQFEIVSRRFAHLARAFASHDSHF